MDINGIIPCTPNANGMIAPDYSIEVSSKQYEKIREEITVELESKSSNKKAWPRGSNDVNLLFDFIKGKLPIRERIDINGERCKSNKFICAQGCITGKPCTLQSPICFIRSNEYNIKSFITKMFGFSPEFPDILSETPETSERKFMMQLKLLSLGI